MFFWLRSQYTVDHVDELLFVGKSLNVCQESRILSPFGVSELLDKKRKLVVRVRVALSLTKTLDSEERKANFIYLTISGATDHDVTIGRFECLVRDDRRVAGA
jgi:hypothetical protein